MILLGSPLLIYPVASLILFHYLFSFSSLMASSRPKVSRSGGTNLCPIHSVFSTLITSLHILALKMALFKEKGEWGYLLSRSTYNSFHLSKHASIAWLFISGITSSTLFKDSSYLVIRIGIMSLSDVKILCLKINCVGFVDYTLIHSSLPFSSSK